MKKLDERTINILKEKLWDCIHRSQDAIRLDKFSKARDCYFEFKGIVKGADFYVGNTPSTPGSLASTWYQSHLYRGEPPGTSDQYFSSLRAVASAIELWLLKEEKIFEDEKHKDHNLSTKGCPFFRRFLPVEPSLIFMLMPFTEKWSNRIWNKHVKPAIERVPSDPPLIAMRADDLFGQDVMQDIFESIMRANVVVADITNRNANVFYELGISHTLGKKVIITAQGKEHIPFDLLRFRHIFYEDNSEGCEELEESLIKNLTELVNE